MAEYKKPYVNLNDTLKALRVQVIDSMPYAINDTPKFKTPEDIFNWLKVRTTYKKDPRGIELFQALPTLLNDNNFHGIRGAGDCDCFTIAALAMLTANGFDSGIVLAGRNKFVPVHIYAYVDTETGRDYFDLTNNWYNVTRQYDYLQHIPLKFNPKEKKNMFLQLAENGTFQTFAYPLSKGGARKAVRQAKKAAKQAQKYGATKQSQAAAQYGKGKAFRQTKRELKRAAKLDRLLPNAVPEQPDIAPEVDDNYIYLPEENIHVREDYYDDLEPAEFQTEMAEQGVPVGRIVELSAKRRERKAAKQAAKQLRKQTKVQGRQASKETKQKLKQRMSGEQKGQIFSKILDTATTAASAITGKDFTGGKGGGEAMPEAAGKQAAPKKINILGMELTPLQAGLGGLTLAGVTVAIVKAVKK